MTWGRCAGCGFSSASCKTVNTHVMSCPDYLKLYKENPAAALDPTKEFERWKLEDDTLENREKAKDAKYSAIRAETKERLRRQRERWQGDKQTETT